MADAFLSLPAADRRDILEIAADRLGRPAAILEKDVWICRVLHILFSIPDGHPMAFQGGTSLSKVYRIVDRLSEDVDLSLDYRAFADGFDPFAPGVSRSAIRRFSDRLKSCVDDHVRHVVGPALEAAVGKIPASGRPAVRNHPRRTNHSQAIQTERLNTAAQTTMATGPRSSATRVRHAVADLIGL